MKRRPNHFENRYNQFVLAGRIACVSGIINPINLETGKPYPVYDAGEGKINYSVVGQDYLKQLGISIKEL